MTSIDDGKRFAMLFAGRKDAFGLDRGGVAHERLTTRKYIDHLKGLPGAGIGVFPVLDDNTVMFAAVDLDEPNFELAAELVDLLPGTQWIERSRSGNAHVWTFFDESVPAWAAKSVLRQATLAVGRRDVEVFPKQDELRPGGVGNYINLPYYGDDRPMLTLADGLQWPLEAWLIAAEDQRTPASLWVDKARRIGAVPPAERAPSEFGNRARVHRCGEYMLEHMHDNPLHPGARATVLFNLAKMFANVENFNEDEVFDVVETYNQAGTEPVPEHEVRRFVGNAFRGEFTSTGCDDALMSDYVDPECPIANA